MKCPTCGNELFRERPSTYYCRDCGTLSDFLVSTRQLSAEVPRLVALCRELLAEQPTYLPPSSAAMLPILDNIREIVQKNNTKIAEAQAPKWRDDDSPKGEFKTASSPLSLTLEEIDVLGQALRDSGIGAVMRVRYRNEIRPTEEMNAVARQIYRTLLAKLTKMRESANADA